MGRVEGVHRVSAALRRLVVRALFHPGVHYPEDFPIIIIPEILMVTSGAAVTSQGRASGLKWKGGEKVHDLAAKFKAFIVTYNSTWESRRGSLRV